MKEQDAEVRAGRRLSTGDVAENDHRHSAPGLARAPLGALLRHRRQYTGDGSLGEAGKRRSRLRGREVAAHGVYADLEDLSVGPAPRGLRGLLRVLKGQLGELFPHLRHAEFVDPVDAGEAAPRDGLELGVRAESAREVEIGELPRTEMVEKPRIIVDPCPHLRSFGEDLGDYLERIGACGVRGAVVGAPVLDFGMEVRAPAVDQRVHGAEPAPGKQDQIPHPGVGSRELRRLVRIAVVQQRVEPARRGVMVGVALGVVIDPVRDPVGGAPRMPGLESLVSAAGQADALQAVVLDVVGHPQLENPHGADDGEGHDPPCPANPVRQCVPGGGLEGVAPDRVRVMPDREAAAREPIPFDPPGIQDAVRHRSGQVPPEALAPGCGHRIPGSADMGVMDVDVLGDLLRERHRRHQELADPALPRRAAVHHVVTGVEGQSGHAAERQHQYDSFPDDQVIGGEHLPQREHQRRRIECHPHPDRQLVPDHVAAAGPGPVQVPLLGPERGVEVVGDPEEGEGTREPPPSVHGGGNDEREDRDRDEVRERIPERGIEHLPRSGRTDTQADRLRLIRRHCGAP